MTDDDQNTEQPKGLEALTPDVSQERPLDSLVPEMQKSGLPDDEAPHDDAPTEVGAIHPRVLDVELEEGHEWTIAFWDDPGPDGVRQDLSQLVRATVLKELSRLPRELREESRSFSGARAFSFESLLEPTRSTLERAGWERREWDPEEYSERMNAWREEARAADLDVPARPISIWRLRAESGPPPHGNSLESTVDRMLESLGDEVWGETPGGMSKLLARELEDRLGADIGPAPEGLETMTSIVFPDAPGAIRWVHPILFQALCDFVGVVLHASFGVRVQWGLCERDERGLVPPPMFRDPETQQTLPIGRALVDWCVSPTPEDEPGSDVAERIEELAESLSSDG